MSYNISKYVIPLDTVDFNFIPTYSNHVYDRVIPIWTKGNLDMRDDEYFEFEIKNGEECESNSNIPDAEINFEYVMCHICNISIPDIFLNEHNLSAKHQTYMQIVDITLDRLKQAINNVQVACNKQKLSKVYFCTSCVTVVNIEDKVKHENGITHINSVNIDRLLQNLLILISNNDKTECNNVKCNMELIRKDETGYRSNLEELLANFVETNNKKDFSKMDNNNNKTDQNPSKNNLNETKVNVIDENCGNKNDIERFMEILMNSHNLEMSIKVLDENYLEIITNEGSHVKISENNFHGFKKMDQNYFQCLLCKDIIKLRNKEDHIYSILHIERASLSFKDAHCVRQITEIWGHCALCNKHIGSSDMHILCNEVHDQLLEKALLADRRFNTFTNNLESTTSKNKETYLHDNSYRILNSHNFSDDKTESPVKTEVETKSNSFKNTCVQNNDASVITNSASINISNDFPNPVNICDICDMDLSNIDVNFHNMTKRHVINKEVKSLKVHYLTEVINEDMLKCIICNCVVANKFDVVKNHLKSTNHVSKYNRLLTTNYIRDLKNCTFFCNICKVKLTKINEITHINETTHKQCMIQQMSTAERVDDIKKSNLILSYYCEVCNIQIHNNKSSILTHNLGAQHIQNADKLHKYNLNHVQSKTNIKTTELKCSDTIFNIHHHMIFKINHLYCLVCEIQVPVNENNMNEHINGYNHRTNYNNILINNHIEIVNDKFNCKICSMNDLKNEVLHCKSKSHINAQVSSHKSNDLSRYDTMTVESSQAPYKVSIESKESSSFTTDSTLATAAADVAFKEFDCAKTTATFKIHHHMINKTNHLYCLVCDVKVPVNENNMNEHIKGYNHISKYSNVLIDNHIEIINNKFICKACSMNDLKNEVLHCKTKDHIDAQESFRKNILGECDTVIEESNSNHSSPYMSIESTDISSLASNSTMVELDMENPTISDDTDNSTSATTDIGSEDFDYANTSASFRIHHHMIYKINHLYCLVCDVKVTVNENNMNEHIQGHNHKTNYNNILIENHIEITNDKFNCKVCSMNDLKNEILHCKSKGHMKAHDLHKGTELGQCDAIIVETNQQSLYESVEPADFSSTTFYSTEFDMKIFPETLDSSASEATNVTSEATDISSEATDISSEATDIASEELDYINTSTSSSLKINNTSNITDLPTYLLQRTSNSKELMCKVCQVRLPNKEDNIATHLQGAKHNAKYEEFKTKLPAEDSMSPTVFSIHYHMTYETDHLKCAICEVEVTVNERNMNEHVKGQNHKTNYSNLLNKNHIENINGKYYCKICFVYIDLEYEIVHCRDKKHLEKLELNKRTTSTMAVLEDTLFELSVRKQACFVAFNSKQVICNICNVKLPNNNNNNLRIHSEGLNHKRNCIKKVSESLNKPTLDLLLKHRSWDQILEICFEGC